jgi:hypothetical protein
MNAQHAEHARKSPGEVDRCGPSLRVEADIDPARDAGITGPLQHLIDVGRKTPVVEMAMRVDKVNRVFGNPPRF